MYGPDFCDYVNGKRSASYGVAHAWLTKSSNRQQLDHRHVYPANLTDQVI